MRERKGIFKGYSIETFWPILIGHTIDTMNFVLILSNNDLDKRKELMRRSFEILYPLYEKLFNNKQKFFDYGNEVVLAILDTKYPINDDGTINVKGIFENLKKNWTKNYNYIYNNTR